MPLIFCFVAWLLNTHMKFDHFLQQLFHPWVQSTASFSSCGPYNCFIESGPLEKVTVVRHHYSTVYCHLMNTVHKCNCKNVKMVCNFLFFFMFEMLLSILIRKQTRLIQSSKNGEDTQFPKSYKVLVMFSPGL